MDGNTQKTSNLVKGEESGADATTLRLEPAWRLRQLPYLQALLLSPPSGYRFEVVAKYQQRSLDFAAKHGISFDVQSAISGWLPIPLIKSLLETKVDPPHTHQVTYALDHLVLKKGPWFLEMSFELPAVLAGSERQLRLCRNLIGQTIKSKYCKGIAFQVREGREAFLSTFGEDLREKTAIIQRCAFPKYFPKPASKSITLLFVNSSNTTNTDSFFIKGGPEVISTYRVLRKTHENLRLVVRSAMPSSYREILANMPGVTVLDKTQPLSVMSEVWKSADIFIHPHHGNMSDSIVEAMSYGLPVITTDVWATSELVTNMKHGILVHDENAARHTTNHILHITNKYVRTIRSQSRPEMVSELVEAVERILSDEGLRRQLGDTAKQEVERGQLSLAHRNFELKRFLDQHICC